MQFYGQGFFNPQLADQALACVEMMDFDRKDFVVQKISQNGTMYQQMQQMQQQMIAMAQLIDSMRGGNETTVGIAQQFGMGGNAVPMAGGQAQPAQMPEEENAESTITRAARERVANSTSPT